MAPLPAPPVSRRLRGREHTTTTSPSPTTTTVQSRRAGGAERDGVRPVYPSPAAGAMSTRSSLWMTSSLAL